jgi:hypothetical protein
MQNTLSVAIITSALLAATLFTGQTAKAQTTSPGVSPQQLGKTVTSNMTQATPNLEKELVCGTAAVLNGPPGLLMGSVCNYLVGKLNSTSQQQSHPSFTSSPSKGTQLSSTKKSVGTSHPSFTSSPSKGTQLSSTKKSVGTSHPSFTSSPSKGTQLSSTKKSVGTSQPSFTSSPSKGTQLSSTKKSVGTSQPSTTNSPLQQQRQQPSCSDGSQPDANGNCPTPPSNNNQNQEQQQTQECPLGEIIPADNPCPTTNSNPTPSENNPPSESGSNSNGGGSSSDNVG